MIFWQIGVFILVWMVSNAVFRRVEKDYQHHKKLNRSSAWLEMGIFFLHGSCSYIFLDLHLGKINFSDAGIWWAGGLIVLGLLVTIIAMARLSWGVAIGQENPGIRAEGFYRYSRNPQVVGYFFVIVGYALLRPMWSGLAWVLLYALIGHRMVQVEERHLANIYGEAYKQYCNRTPRYIGKIKR
jgi:protein-S-isoprenylcysteine O-methyltransferase Ste14